MNIKYIDIHSHLGFADYGKDLKEVIKRMEDSGVATITVGTDLESSKEAVKIADEFENVWACIGAHPADHEKSADLVASKRDFVFDELDFEELVKNPKVVAIGECGLDYFRLEGEFKQGLALRGEPGVGAQGTRLIEDFCEQKRNKNPNEWTAPVRSEATGKGESLVEFIEQEKNRQKKEFKKQIEFAIKYNKPLMLHLRDRISGGETLRIKKGFSSGNSAYSDAYDILKKYKNARGNLHFFAGSLEWAKKFIDLGFTISFTGVITFARQYDEIIKNIPLDKIHAETDSPFVAPIPYRGKRNEPAYVVEVVKKIAEIRGGDFETVRLQLITNSNKTFGLNI